MKYFYFEQVCFLSDAVLFLLDYYVVFIVYFSGGLSMSYRLQFLCAADMYLNPDLYSTSFETNDHFGMTISGPSENIFTSTKNRSAAVKHESLLTCETEHRPRWSSLIHIQALANVLKRSVISIYPDNTGFP